MENADQTILLWINGWAGKAPLLDGAVEWVVSDYLVPVALALTLLALWFAGADASARHRYQTGVLAALVSTALANWAVMITNWSYFRPRPFVDLDVTLLFYEPTDSSFPANTAAAAFAIATAIWCVNRRLGTAALVTAGLFGLSRVYAGVHYPSDILAGAAIGAAVALLVFRLMALVHLLPTTVIKVARILCLA